jgi:hypothetical protein
MYLLVIQIHCIYVPGQFLEGIGRQNSAVRGEGPKTWPQLGRVRPARNGRQRWQVGQKTRRYVLGDETRRIHTGGGHQLVGGRGEHVGQRRLRQAGRGGCTSAPAAAAAAGQPGPVAAMRRRLGDALRRERQRAGRVAEMFQAAPWRGGRRMVLHNMRRGRQLGDVSWRRAGGHVRGGREDRRTLGGRGGGIWSVANHDQTHFVHRLVGRRTGFQIYISQIISCFFTSNSGQLKSEKINPD